MCKNEYTYHSNDPLIMMLCETKLLYEHFYNSLALPSKVKYSLTLEKNA